MPMKFRMPMKAGFMGRRKAVEKMSSFLNRLSGRLDSSGADGDRINAEARVAAQSRMGEASLIFWSLRSFEQCCRRKVFGASTKW